MSKSAKNLKAPISHSRSTFKFDAQTAAFLAHKTSLQLTSQKSDSSVPTHKSSASSLNRPTANRSFHKTSLSPGGDTDPNKSQPSIVPAFLRRSLGKDPRENICIELKTDEKIPEDSGEPPKRHRRSQHSTFSWEIGDIEIRLNERLIKGSRNSDSKEKFEACREALRELIEANPANSSLLTKIAKAVDAWTRELESASQKRVRSQSIEQSFEATAKLTDEISKLKERVIFLGKENSRLNRQLADVTSCMAFPGPQSHVSDLIKSLQEEVSIHRKREDLLMNIINKMREKGYPVGDIQKTPRSEKQLSDESTRNSATDTESLKTPQSGFLTDLACREDEDCEMSYSPTPGFETEESVQMMPSDDRPAVPRLSLPISNDMGHKGVDLRLVKYSPA